MLTSLKSLLADAQRRGSVAQNVALAVNIPVDKRTKRKLKVGVDIPTPDETRQIIEAAGNLRPLFVAATFTGMRASELRGVRWEDVDLKHAELHVRQRADRYNVIGRPKSEAGERTIPLWTGGHQYLEGVEAACPKGSANLVFPNAKGRVQDHKIIARAMEKVVRAAGLITATNKPKYPGLHSLRHFYASWCMNRRADGGLELPVKVVQERLGHASIVMTMDRYGHLFPRSDDGSELAEQPSELCSGVHAT